MKRFVMAVVLTGVISLTAQAGNVPTNAIVSPVPPPPPATASPVVNTIVVNLILTITTLIGR